MPCEREFEILQKEDVVVSFGGTPLTGFAREDSILPEYVGPDEIEVIYGTDGEFGYSRGIEPHRKYTLKFPRGAASANILREAFEAETRATFSITRLVNNERIVFSDCARVVAATAYGAIGSTTEEEFMIFAPNVELGNLSVEAA